MPSREFSWLARTCAFGGKLVGRAAALAALIAVGEEVDAAVAAGDVEAVLETVGVAQVAAIAADIVSGALV